MCIHCFQSVAQRLFEVRLRMTQGSLMLQLASQTQGHAHTPVVQDALDQRLVLQLRQQLILRSEKANQRFEQTILHG